MRFATSRASSWCRSSVMPSLLRLRSATYGIVPARLPVSKEGRLNLDDLRAVVGEQASAVRPGPDAGEVKDTRTPSNGRVGWIPAPYRSTGHAFASE